MSLYQTVVPVARRALVNLRAFTVKGASHFAQQGEAEAVLLETRFAPDMFTFAQQIRSVCHIIEWGIANLSGTSGPTVVEDDASVAEMLARIDRTIALLDSASPEIIDGRAGQEVIMPIPDNRALHFADGADYVGGFVLPNLFFHSSVAYAIMRHRGAPLGKIDFLGELDVREA